MRVIFAIFLLFVSAQANATFLPTTTCLPGDVVACIQITSSTWELENTGFNNNIYRNTIEGVIDLSEEVGNLEFNYAVLVDGFQDNQVSCNSVGGGAIIASGPILCEIQGYSTASDWGGSGNFSRTLPYTTNFQKTIQPLPNYNRLVGVPINQPDGVVVLGMEATYSTGLTIAGCGEGFGAAGYVGDCEIFQSSIPEPTSIALMGLGLAGLGFAKRKRTQS